MSLHTVDTHAPVDPLHLMLLIGGEHRESERRIEVRNPARLDDVVGSIPDATTAEVDDAIAAAAAAAPAWGATSAAERIALFAAIADAIESQADDIATLEVRENGSARYIAAREVLGAASIWREVADYLAEILTPKDYPSGDGFVRVERRPFGVVGCIVPWNAPLILTANKIAPALAAGNAIVLKPSPFSPLGASRIAEIAASILPPGVVNIVNGGGEAGAAIVAHREIRKLSFTGGGVTAQHIMRQAADTLTAVHFELGGNDPAIVLDDVDVRATVDRIVDSAFRRSGQVCFAVKRVYVPRALAAEFRDELVARVDAITVGDPLEPGVTMGPMNNQGQLERIRGLLERLEGSGRDVRVLGSRVSPETWGDGYFIQPAVVLDAQQGDEIVATEQFGPILPIVVYDDLEQAISWANDTEFGLCSSVWSPNRERAIQVADRIEAGMTIINSHLFTRVGMKEIPFGGWKQSGIGWEASPYGIEEYLQFHSLDVQSMP
ncbi:aldehyde dehydrogenase family protein [Subtercola sp. YIM 133946]|uniref:aldehyde dehydrogenase family protein n=1 Tax=Subtercola sp. YIM 133946 TaxID=3118909 RepID=UPI002F940E7D